MRKSASEVIRNLEMRVARLERQANLNPKSKTLFADKAYQCFDELFESFSKRLPMFKVVTKFKNVPQGKDPAYIGAHLKMDYQRAGVILMANPLLATGSVELGDMTFNTRITLSDFERGTPIFRISFETTKVGERSEWDTHEIVGEKGKIDRQVRSLPMIGGRKASNRTASLHQSTGLEMVSMIEDQYNEYGLDEDYIEIEGQDQSRATGDTYMLVSLEGYYGIVRVDGRREDVEMVSDDYRSIKRVYDSNLG